MRQSKKNIKEGALYRNAKGHVRRLVCVYTAKETVCDRTYAIWERMWPRLRLEEWVQQNVARSHEKHNLDFTPNEYMGQMDFDGFKRWLGVEWAQIDATFPLVEVDPTDIMSDRNVQELNSSGVLTTSMIRKSVRDASFILRILLKPPAGGGRVYVIWQGRIGEIHQPVYRSMKDHLRAGAWFLAGSLPSHQDVVLLFRYPEDFSSARLKKVAFDDINTACLPISSQSPVEYAAVAVVTDGERYKMIADRGNKNYTYTSYKDFISAVWRTCT